MTTISSTGQSASQISSVGTVEATQHISAVSQSAGTQDIPVTSHQESSAAAPVLSAPGTTDYAGASSFSAMYTQLIVLMCEVNRDSYAANRDTALVQMEARVGQLEEAAKKSRNAAIVGLAMSVVSAGVSIAGATVTTVSSTKNMAQLPGAQKGTVAGDVAPQAGKTMPADIPDAPQTTPGMNQSQSVSLDSQSAAKAQTLEAQPAQDVKAAQSTKSTDSPDAPDAPDNAADLEQRANMARVENGTVKSQVLTMIFRTGADFATSIGQSTSGMINAEAETVRATAEAIEAKRQMSTSSVQQFNELMSKFNTILSSYLEAEIRAASAAAQA